MASTLKSLTRELAAAKKRIVALAALLRKAKTKAKNGKAKPKAKAPAKRKAPPSKRTKRHDLGEAQLEWEPWTKSADGTDRYFRYGVGLNGENKGASVIVLVTERTADGWKWVIYPKNDYGNLLPPKFQHEQSGPAGNHLEARAAADMAVGL